MINKKLQDFVSKMVQAYEEFESVNKNILHFHAITITQFPEFFDFKLLAIKDLRYSNRGKTPETVDFLCEYIINGEKEQKFLLECCETFFKIQDKNSNEYKFLTGK